MGNIKMMFSAVFLSIIASCITTDFTASIKWEDAPEFQYPILETDYIIKCYATASPSPIIDWLKNGESLKTGPRFVVVPTGLLIRNIGFEDDGNYTCRATVISTGEILERYISVEIYVEPNITALPEILEAIEGQSFSAYCNATGKPNPEYIWIKDWTQENVATADRFLVNPQTGLLQITPVQQQDYGTYTCRAVSAAGSTTSKTLLNIIVQPKVYEFLNYTSGLNYKVAIRCLATGRPAPLITFQRWETEEEFLPNQQPNDDRIFLEQHRNEDEGKSSGILRISKLMRSDDGLYRCIARNNAGTAYQTGHITVEFPPSFDHMKDLLPTFSWQERKANLSCLAMSIPNSTISWRWNGRPVEEYNDKNLFIEGYGPGSNLIITPVDRKYYSAYTCIAMNMYGRKEIDMELREAVIPNTVEGLKPQTPYQFRFAARNEVGVGPWGGNMILLRLKRSSPAVPNILHAPIQEEHNEKVVYSPYSEHFEIRWSTPDDNGEPIDFYNIKYCPVLEVHGEWTELQNECIIRDVIDATNFEMDNLTGNTYYRIELRAHNSIGYSLPSVFTTKTANGVSDTPNSNI